MYIPAVWLCFAKCAKLNCANGNNSAMSVYVWQALEGSRTTLGSDHPHTLLAGNNLAVVYQMEGRLEQADCSLYRSLYYSLPDGKTTRAHHVTSSTPRDIEHTT